MSTGFTIKEEKQVAELPLGQTLINAHQWFSSSLLQLMHLRGHEDLTDAHLTFFCSLNCGLTHASEVARRMGITRQAVYKTTKELQRVGVLELLDDQADGRQKVISMTPQGERIAIDARECLDLVEAQLIQRIGKQNFDALRQILKQDWGPSIAYPDTPAE